MDRESVRKLIEDGGAVLGIELGSTRIKAVLIGNDRSPVASGDCEWQNRFENGVWTYTMDDVWSGLRAAYAALAADVREKYGAELRRVAAMGVSAMMHGYLALGADGQLLAPFRTWRNTITERAAEELTREFSFNIPQRWSAAHLYQAILNGERHVADIDYLTTLSGYVHWRLTGERVIGLGDAAGMFPVDSAALDYDGAMLDKFDALTAPKGYAWRIRDILPKALAAGERAGTLTPEGAKLLDPTGTLEPGAPLCPPEGDAGTGMVATNSVAARTGNVSAGTSVFAMVVLEKPLAHCYTEIDMVTTPSGKAVAMVHCNNCTSDLDAWVKLLREASGLLGGTTDIGEIYGKLYRLALEGDADCGGIASYNYFAGETIAKLDEGRPLLVRLPDARFSLANFMRANLYGAMATLKLGMDVLTEKESVAVENLTGHGGLFKTKGVAQRLMASALGVPITCMETAGEGGPWGIALLADYMLRGGETLESYLSEKVFKDAKGETIAPDERDSIGFAKYIKLYESGLAAERAAVDSFK